MMASISFKIILGEGKSVFEYRRNKIGHEFILFNFSSGYTEAHYTISFSTL